MSRLKQLAGFSRCDFCDEFAGGSANSFARLYGDLLRCRVITEHSEFVVLPSMGQIVPGYLLLLPREHYRSFADMSESVLARAESLKTQLVRQLAPLFGKYLFFEHGVRTPDSGGCGVSHAHLHAVPFPANKEPIEKLRSDFEFVRVSGLIDLKSVAPEQSYLYYESLSKDRYVFYAPFIQSQYLRRLLAENLGVQDWDWRQVDEEETLVTTYTRASSVFADFYWQ